MKLVNADVDQIQVFVMINNVEVLIKADVNVIDKGRCDEELIWNPSICECDRSRDIWQYLDYKIVNVEKS